MRGISRFAGKTGGAGLESLAPGKAVLRPLILRKVGGV